MAGVPFNKQMRAVTREIHSISDALVNAKLALALSSDEVWGEGLLVFYEVFRYLEEAMRRHKDSPLGSLWIPGMDRTQAFENDLKHYLGADWTKNYEVRPEVADYLVHLKTVEEQDPVLLCAYVYHLYMGLASGGQILHKKRAFRGKLLSTKCESSAPGYQVTTFNEISISALKKHLVDSINAVACDQLTGEQRRLMLEESKHVFTLNIAIIGTIKSVNLVLIRNFALLLSFVVFLLLVYFWFKP